MDSGLRGRVLKKIGPFELDRVHCVDARDGLRQLPNRCVHAVVTSPNYNLVRDWHGAVRRSSRQFKQFEKLQEKWYRDIMPEAEYQEEQKRYVREMMRVCRGSVFYNHKVRYAFKRRGTYYHPMHWLSEFPIWCEIIWDRNGGRPSNTPRYLVSDERIYQIGRPARWRKTSLTTVWRINARPQGLRHVCPFPVELVRNCIEPSTAPGDIVLDPFMGSGTTAEGALQLGRHVLGFEIDPVMCEEANERIAEFL